MDVSTFVLKDFGGVIDSTLRLAANENAFIVYDHVRNSFNQQGDKERLLCAFHFALESTIELDAEIATWHNNFQQKLARKARESCGLVITVDYLISSRN